MSAAAAHHPDGGGGPHVFVADLDHPILADADDHHLRRALRLRDGDPCTVSDGQGRWRSCVLGSGGPEPVGAIVEVAAPATTLTLGIALTKGAKPELAVQKATELGLDRIVLFVAARSIPRWDDTRTAKQLGRLDRVAREAAMQSRRVRIPSVVGLRDLATASEFDGAVLADMGASAYAGQPTVLIGPEGGWDDTERVDLPRVGLGPHVLRAETAAIAAATLMVAHHRPIPGQRTG